MLKWTPWTPVALAGGIVAGLLIGSSLGQAVYVRQLLARPMWSIVATVAGLGLAVAVIAVEKTGTLLGHRPNVAHLSPGWRSLSFLVLGLISGAILGLCQWFVLRRQLPRVRHWIAISAAALAIAFSSSLLPVELVGGIGSSVGVVTAVILAGLTFGAFTGRPLRA